MGELKKVVDRDFGLCPKCGSRLLYLLSNYQIGVPAAGGQNLSKILGEDKDITGICPNCNHRVQLTSSIYGITTPQYEKLVSDQQYIKNKVNLIGYIDEKG